MSTKISQLTGASTLTGPEVVAGVQSGNSRKITAAQFFSSNLFTQTGTGAVARSPNSKMGDIVSVKDFGAKGDGVTDDTAAIVAGEAARPIGSTLFWPAGTYKISGAITASKAGSWLLDGVTINSNAGQLSITSSDFTLRGGKSTLNYTPGSPASSLDRAIRIVGVTSAEQGLTGPLAVGATSFVDTSATSVIAGDWIIVIDNNVGINYQRLEFHQVVSKVGTTINFAEPLALAFGTFTQQWIKVTTPVQNVIVEGLTVVIADTTQSNIGVDAQAGLIDFTLRDCTFDIANGLAWQTFLAHNCNVHDNVVRRQTRRVGISSCHAGSFSRNKFWQSTALAIDGAVTIETGTSAVLIDHNQVFAASGGAAAFYASEADGCIYDHNTIVGDGSTIGIYISGGSQNLLTGNKFTNLGEGIRFVKVDAKAVSDNRAQANIFRNTTIGVNVGSTVTGTVVNESDVDSTVTTPIQNAAADTRTDRVLAFTPTLTFATPGDLNVVYSNRIGRYSVIGDKCYISGRISTTTFTYTTAASFLEITGLPFTSAASGVAANIFVGMSGWTKLNYTTISGNINASSAIMAFNAFGSAQASSNLTVTEVITTSTVNIYFQGWYEIG